MASSVHPEIASDLSMDDFLFQEMDLDALPLLLLDVDEDDVLLTSAELAMTRPTSLQETSCPAIDPDVPMRSVPSTTTSTSTTVTVNSSSSSTKDAVYSPLLLPWSLCCSPVEMDTTLSPAPSLSLLDASLSTCSPRPSGQTVLVPMMQMMPRCSSTSRSCGSHCNCDSSSDSTSPGSSSVSSSVTSLITTTAVKSRQSSAKLQSMAALAPMASALLPYAMPVAYVPPFPITTSSATATRATAMDSDDATAVKTKRAIRQMKNRESANKSRLRRNARLPTLMTDVAELKKKELGLQTVVAGLRAENKSLLDQNAFLRSLVISCKQESSSRKEDPLDAAASLLLSSPLAMDQSRVALHVLENGRKKTDSDEIGGDTQVSDMTILTPRPGKRRAVASTLSTTASLTVCASVFGVTVFTSYDGDAVDAGTIRGVGRVLHESSKSCGMAKCSLEASKSLVALVETTVGSWWHEITSSELVFGVLLNVLSLVAIMLLYRLCESHARRGVNKCGHA